MTPDDTILYKTDFPLPDRQNNYEAALNEAAGKLRCLDIDGIADRSGAIVIASGKEKALLLPFIGDEIRVTHPGMAITIASNAGEVPLWAKILVLHYLVMAKGTGLRGEQVTFKQLEGGMGYDPAFHRRVIRPVIDRFGPALAGFLVAGERAGGVRSGESSHALSFRAFPRVKVVFVLHEGDEEFPPSGSVIFDASIADYLSTEDVAVLCNMLAVRIIKAAQP
jgi:hypothetical protein